MGSPTKPHDWSSGLSTWEPVVREMPLTQITSSHLHAAGRSEWRSRSAPVLPGTLCSDATMAGTLVKEAPCSFCPLSILVVAAAAPRVSEQSLELQGPGHRGAPAGTWPFHAEGKRTAPRCAQRKCHSSSQRKTRNAKPDDIHPSASINAMGTRELPDVRHMWVLGWQAVHWCSTHTHTHTHTEPKRGNDAGLLVLLML